MSKKQKKNSYKEFEQQQKFFDSLTDVSDALEKGIRRKYIVKMIKRTVEKGYDVVNKSYLRDY